MWCWIHCSNILLVCPPQFCYTGRWWATRTCAATRSRSRTSAWHARSTTRRGWAPPARTPGWRRKSSSRRSSPSPVMCGGGYSLTLKCMGTVAKCPIPLPPTPPPPAPMKRYMTSCTNLIAIRTLSGCTYMYTACLVLENPTSCPWFSLWCEPKCGVFNCASSARVKWASHQKCESFLHFLVTCHSNNATSISVSFPFQIRSRTQSRLRMGQNCRALCPEVTDRRPLVIYFAVGNAPEIQTPHKCMMA